MLKVALLFSGQVRPLCPLTFNRGLQILTKGLNVDVYLSFWDAPGISGNHNIARLMNNNRMIDFDIDQFIDKAFLGFNIKGISKINQTRWKDNLSGPYKSILSANNYSPITLNSLPQLFQIYNSYQMVDQNENYTHFVRCRFDSVFLFPLLNEISSFKLGVSSINFGRAYYPNRIYDIFFIADKDASSYVFNTWLEVPSLVNNKFNNQLDPRDCCRLLYLTCLLSSINVSSTNTRICDVYRGLFSYFKVIFLNGYSRHILSIPVTLQFIKSFSQIFYVVIKKYFFPYCK